MEGSWTVLNDGNSRLSHIRCPGRSLFLLATQVSDHSVGAIGPCPLCLSEIFVSMFLYEIHHSILESRHWCALFVVASSLAIYSCFCAAIPCWWAMSQCNVHICSLKQVTSAFTTSSFFFLYTRMLISDLIFWEADIALEVVVRGGAVSGLMIEFLYDEAPTHFVQPPFVLRQWSIRAIFFFFLTVSFIFNGKRTREC